MSMRRTTTLERLSDLVEPGGMALVSTPYHGYLNNLKLAVTDSSDKFFTALCTHCHIKLWSFRTLCTLLQGAGEGVQFLCAGLVPVLLKSITISGSTRT